MIGLIFGIILSFWIYPVVKKNGGNPWYWIVGTVIIWPVFTFIVGIKYKSRGLVVVGCIGFCILAYTGFIFMKLVGNYY